MIEEHKRFAEAIIRGEVPSEAAKSVGLPESAVEPLMQNPEIRQFLRNHSVATITVRPQQPPLPGTPEANGVIPPCDGDPLSMLEKVMDNPQVDLAKRMAAAQAILPYKYAKLGEMGKKEKQQQKAEEAGGSTAKFAPRKPPSGHLSSVK